MDGLSTNPPVCKHIHYTVQSFRTPTKLRANKCEEDRQAIYMDLRRWSSTTRRWYVLSEYHVHEEVLSSQYLNLKQGPRKGKNTTIQLQSPIFQQIKIMVILYSTKYWRLAHQKNCPDYVSTCKLTPNKTVSHIIKCHPCTLWFRFLCNQLGRTLKSQQQHEKPATWQDQ